MIESAVSDPVVSSPRNLRASPKGPLPTFKRIAEHLEVPSVCKFAALKWVGRFRSKTGSGEVSINYSELYTEVDVETSLMRQRWLISESERGAIRVRVPRIEVPQTIWDPEAGTTVIENRRWFRLVFSDCPREEVIFEEPTQVRELPHRRAQNVIYARSDFSGFRSLDDCLWGMRKLDQIIQRASTESAVEVR